MKGLFPEIIWWISTVSWQITLNGKGIQLFYTLHLCFNYM